MVSCALAVSFDDYGTTRRGSPPSAALYGVRGSIAGLEGEHTNLLLNGISLDVTDGPFAFPATLADGVDFEVTVQAPQKHACAVERSKGKIAGADATGVAVACVSRDATLKALSVSVGPLSPAFDAGKLTYTVRARRKGILAADNSVSPTVTVSAAPANPAAQVSIGGITLQPGIPSPPFAVNDGPTPLDIVVAVPNVSVLHYTVVVDGEDFDYVKASDTTQRAAFGATVALSGDTLAVAAPGNYSGEIVPVGFVAAQGVYIFARSGSTWSQQALIRDMPGERSYVLSIGLDGGTLAIASRGADAVPHTVAIYARTGATWTRQPFDIGMANEVCDAIAISGETVAVGCYDLASISISVRIFKRTGAAWAQEGAFIRAAPAGWVPTLALSGDTLVIGDGLEASAATGIGGNQDDTSAPNAGAAYVVGRSGTTWSLQAYVKASDTSANADFGAAVAVSGDTLVVGSPGAIAADGTSPRAGRAYVFTRSGGVWSQEAILKGPSLARDLFGGALAILADTVAVGAPADNLESGAVYLFHRTAAVWSQGTRVAAPVSGRAAYGSSVAIASEVLAVGAPNEESNATGINGDRTDHSLVAAGAVYVH